MESITVRGTAKLKGTVHVSGAKNASLPILAATLLAAGTHRIRNVPDLRDVDTTRRLLEKLGGEVRGSGDLTVETGKVTAAE